MFRSNFHVVPGDRHILICADYVFAHDHAPEMREWLRDNTPGAVWTGMVIEFKTEQDMVLFLLRWE